ncbi:MAG TPA: carboxypeptidase regulatory-like domain-containing protein [Candidatus Acidoferrales bacterium]|nr:carboxypeptidase regulatory-like domain-containing protein [Candidatus Acidoferrales bacterium]
MKKIHCVVFALVLTLLCAASSWSQEQITTGTVKGDITDPRGGGVAGVAIEIKNLDTNLTRTDSTNADGHFAFLNLPPGRYTLTIVKQGFATVEQQNINLTVGQAITLPITLKVSSVSETIVVTDVPLIETTTTQSSTTLDELSVEKTPVLGRKFEDLLTLTPGVNIVQGPDGDEINFNGQRGIFNNISLDGGDYNNGFFGEQVGGQRAAVDITLEAVKEFQVVASGASAEFGRTAGGVVNVITKSGTNDVHGSLFYFQRLEALSADTSDGKPLQDFHREQFGGTIGGPIKKNKMFIFGAFEQILENLTRPNLSTPLGPACSVANPVFGPGGNITDIQIGASAECQRQTLLNFLKTSRSQDDSLAVKHPIRNSAALGRFDWNVTPKNQFSASYNFDYSKNTNQTFDVATYGASANGIEGPSNINSINFNLFTALSPIKLNEAHVSFSRENRPRAAVKSSIPADTAMGFVTTFRFGAPFFLEPTIDEVFKRIQVKDNFSIIAGKHTIKFGGEWLHSNNTQVFRGFFTGRYIFDSVVGFLHYASDGPTVRKCANGSYGTPAQCTGAGSSATTFGPLLLYLQHAGTNGTTTDAAGASDISNENYALFLQDKWQIRPNLTLNYGLRWEAQIFPDPVIPPAQTAYGVNLSDPRFPSTGKIPNATKMFQPRLGLAWDVRNNGKSVVRASWGIYDAQQNMLTQVGAITTNGVQQQTLFAGDVGAGVFISPNGPAPVWPNPITPAALPPGTFPFQPGITVFDRNYNNPRIYAANFGFTQQLAPDWAGYIDVTWAQGVYLTRFVDPNTGSTVTVPLNGDTVSYSGTAPFPNLGSVTDTQSSAHSLYRGFTIGARKRFRHGFQLEGNYVLSEDLDDDSNERDPFTFRYFNRFNFRKDYSFSDRDSRHKFNFYAYTKLPAGFEFSGRVQAHTAQPITDNFTAVPTGAPCTATNSNTRVVAGIDCGRNHLRKDNGFFSFDWRAARPFHFGDRYALIPMVEVFNSFNNRNNVNPLVTPGLFNFDGFLRQGVGDPLQAQLAVKFTF